MTLDRNAEVEASRLEYKAVYPNYWTVGDRTLQSILENPIAQALTAFVTPTLQFRVKLCKVQIAVNNACYQRARRHSC
ncbi:hypothetical protein [Calothrix sp. NIES-2098]|uniref:hypothetical protein n=1 Tax=Calothrix sp. NIES-2098 TaxID=1954171 RepID=UPI0030DD7563